MSELDKAIKGLESALPSDADTYAFHSALMVVLDAARRFASLTSPEDVQVLLESWVTIGRNLPDPGEWDGELMGSFAVIDHHFRKALRSVEEGNQE